MGKELVSLKGTKEGLILAIAPKSDFAAVIAALEAKLMTAKDFWRGATVTINSIPAQWTDREREQLLALLEQFEMVLKVSFAPVQSQAHTAGVLPNNDWHRAGNNALIVKRNLRSGQRIVHDGSLVVVGDVNPGAELVATGDIIILGTLRGMAHAGSQGDVTAVVMALSLQPMQLRIANYISRAPDGPMETPAFPEVARISGDRIAVQEYSPLLLFN